MAAPTGALVTTSGYPIIDPDTINPQADWPNIEQAQADWLDTHAILQFDTRTALMLERPSMPPGEVGFAWIKDEKMLNYWTGTGWAEVVPRDTGWVNAGFTAATGFTMVGQVCRRRAGMVSIQLNMTRTGAPLQVSPSIVNTDVANIPGGWQPSQSNGSLGGGPSGGSFTAYASTAGKVVFTHMHEQMDTGATFNVFGTYML
jgi:hypothetical protein